MFSLVCNLSAQQSHDGNYYLLNSKTVSKESNSKQILTDLALGNNKDTKATFIKIYYSLESKINIIANNNIELNLRFNKPNIIGDINYRNFKVDSLLIPDYVNIIVRVNYRENSIYNRQHLVPIKGVKLILDSKAISNESKDYSLNIEVMSFEFSEADLDKFNQMLKLINHYYGYSSLLESLNKKSKTKSYQNRAEASEIFIQWHETSRASAQSKKLELNRLLNLKTFDPEKYVKKSKELERHNKRSTTLLNQTLETELNKGFIADKQKYIQKLISLSKIYYDDSKSHQPYIAGSYSDIILLSQKAGELETIAHISNYYDNYAYGNQKTIKTSLYEGFIADARYYLDKSKNNMALLQLKNAAFIQEYFGLPKSELYSSTLAETLNGMIKSFLKVSNMAFKSNNFKMAEDYYLNAEKVFADNIELFRETDIKATPFSIYIGAQKDLAKIFIEDYKYQEAEILLENCEKIIREKNLADDIEINKLLNRAYNGVFSSKLSKAQGMASNDLGAATTEIYMAKSYYDSHNKLNNKKLLDDISYSIFLEYMQKGEILLDKGNHDEAMSKLLMAKQIQVDLLGYDVDRMDELLKISSVPIIMDMIEESSLHNWAKRSEDAVTVLEEAKEMQHIYHQEQNTDVNIAMSTLETKMNKRHCIDIEFEFKQNIKFIEKNIKSGNFGEANDTYSQSYDLIVNNKECNFDIQNLDELKANYIEVFDFYNDYLRMKDKLFGEGYDEMISSYLELRIYYLEKDIDKYNFYLPSLNEFVKQQNQSKLTENSVKYFINKQQYQLAFEYLQILKSQGVEALDTKELQIELGTALWKSFDGDSEGRSSMAQDLSGDDKWFKYFIKTMNKK